MPTALPPPGAPDVLYLVDLSGYVFRAYHAISPLTSPTGEPTHATYGTVAMLSRLIAQRKPAYFAIAMDPGDRTFRHDLDARYKAHRPPPPPDLAIQMQRCKEIVEAYRIPVFHQEKLEADDLIAVAVERAKEKGLRVVIASSDKDLMQLVDDHRVMMWDAMRNKVYGTPEVIEKFGVPPSQVRDLLALVGDTSDNVPGVPGIGPKTAAELLQQLGSLEGIYEKLHFVKRPRIRELLKQHEADARISQRLVTFHMDAPLTLDLDALRPGNPDSARLKELFTELGFTQLIRSIPNAAPATAATPTTATPATKAKAPSTSGTAQAAATSTDPSAATATATSAATDAAAGTAASASAATATSTDAATTAASTPATTTATAEGEAAAPATGNYRAITTTADLSRFADEVKKAKRLALEVHTTSRDAMTTHVCGIALAHTPGSAVYVPFGHRYLGAPPQLSMTSFLEVLGPILADASIAKIGHDMKFNEVVLDRHKGALAGVAFDTMLAAYLLDPDAPNDLAVIAENDASIKLESYEAIAPKRRGQPQRTLDEIDIDQAARYAAPHADVTLALTERYEPRLRAENLHKLLTDVELPLEAILAQMEEVGVLVDPEALGALRVQMTAELATLEEKARQAAGQELNLASPRQLETILFDVLKLKVTKRTKTGRSTDAEVLEALSDDHPLPGIVLEHRAIAKLLGTYVDALPKLIHKDTGRIHTRWSQAVAATGRLSSQDPNLQNIPIRTPLGRMIRRAFVAPPGSVILSADYSQIELRILAHLSKDAVLCDAFQNKQDVHVRTAMEIFGVDAAGVTDEMRRRSKTINFGVIYGMGEAALTKRLGITRAEAAKFIDAYFERYSGVAKFMEKTMADARQTEVVRTLMGRLRRLPDLRSGDRQRRAQAERIAQNTPIQGTAADLLKLAMVRLAKPVVPGARMVLTVHDELAFEVPKEAAEEAAAKVRHAMETVFQLDVPLLVEVGHGPTWADAH